MRHHLVVFLLCLLPGRLALAQGADSVSAAARPAWLERHDPDLALKRSLMVPGLGQIYNRQYWKVPIVYAGIGGAVSLAIYFGAQHRLYTRAYQYRGWQQQLEEGEPHPFPEYADEYARVVADIGQGQDISASSLKPFRDKFRRNRDLSLFGVGLVYGLAALDAFISAHLLEFDVGEDLTASVVPFAGGQGVSIRVTW
ncbi:MAG: DUF5683 domain-containing protein [Rhodothermales bacterium]